MVKQTVMNLGFENILPLLGTWLSGVKQHPVAGSLIDWALAPEPIQLTLVFIVSSMVMVWRLNAVEKKGLKAPWWVP